ncbi:hypothetical protein Hdeb2414_s0319g00866581 [Helianthus debilis subsp. tardiflorus]
MCANKNQSHVRCPLFVKATSLYKQQLLSSKTAVSASPFSSPRCLPPHTIYHDHQMEDDEEFGDMPPMSSNRRSTPQYLSFVDHSFMVWPLQPSISQLKAP